MKQTLSDIIGHVFDLHRGRSTYGELVDEIDHHGLAVVLILFSLPSALPLPAAGYSTLLSIPLFIIGIRLLCGYEKLWLPPKLRQKPFHPEQFNPKLVHAMLRLVHFVERFSKPRLVRLVRSRGVRILLGILICALAFSMFLPIPGTNTAPAFGIFLLGFALLEDDGLLLLVGILSCLVAMSISITIIFFGYKSYLFLKQSIREFF
jgi:hypothetical protein